MKIFKEICDRKENYKLCFEAVATVDRNYACAASATFNGLFYVNLENGESTFINFFPNEKIDGERLFYSACYVEGKVFFAPQSAKCIHVFHIATERFTQIEIEEQACKPYNRNAKFCETFAYKSKVIMVGAFYPAILVIDAVSENVKYYPIKIETSFLFRHGVLRKNRYFVSSCITNVFIEINLDTMEIKEHRLPNGQKGSWNLCDDSKNIWFTPKNEKECFVKWNPDTDEFYELEKSSDASLPQCGFLFSYYNNGFIYSIPDVAEMGISINVDTLEIAKNINIPCLLNEKMGVCFQTEKEMCLVKAPIQISFYEQKDVGFYLMDKITQEIKTITFNFLYGYDKYLSACASDMLEKKNINIESDVYNLSYFLMLMTYYENECRERKQRKMVSQKIWNVFNE